MMNKTDVFAKYVGNLRWLAERTVFLTLHGSHAYGTNGPGSDVDVKGIFIAPKQYTLGFDTVNCVDKGFGELDCALYEVREYAKLALQNNPNVLELLFIDPNDWIYSTPAWQRLVEIRDSFLSRAVKHRYSGYAVSQLKRIESHRNWLLTPPKEKPTRSKYGLPETSLVPKEQREVLEAMMLKIVENWRIDTAMLTDAERVDFLNKEAATLADMKLAGDDLYVAAGHKLGLDAGAMEHLKAERAYRQAIKEWDQYQTWLRERNPIRAELEAKWGYDSKHGLHLVRLLRQCREILTTGKLIVKRPDAEELKAIRYEGTWSFERLKEWAMQQDAELEVLMETSPLPRTPNRDKVLGTIVSLNQDYLDRNPRSYEEEFWLKSRW